MAQKFVLHRVNTVVPLSGYLLFVKFDDGVSKIYDCNQLFIHETLGSIFNELKIKEGLFEQVKVAIAGLGVEWNDEIDFNCNDLYRYGQTIESNSASNENGYSRATTKPTTSRKKKALVKA